MDRATVEEWIRAHVSPVGPIETAHERAWATVLRVPLADRTAYLYFRIHPQRLQAWREVNKLAARELMRGGHWIVP